MPCERLQRALMTRLVHYYEAALRLARIPIVDPFKEQIESITKFLESELDWVFRADSRLINYCREHSNTFC